MTTAAELHAFAEDPAAFVGVGADEERITTDRYIATFSPGGHYWSTGVSRVRFHPGAVAEGVEEVRALMRERQRFAASWVVGPSATPSGIVQLLFEAGLVAESDEGSVILLLTEAPKVRPGAFDVRPVVSLEDHLATIEVGSAAFSFASDDDVDERARARETFEVERAGDHTVRLLAVDGDRPVATGRAWFSQLGLYLGGGATIPTDRRRGAMSALIAEAWNEAVRRDTPALVTFGGQMAAPVLERLGFRPLGRVRHLIDRIDRHRPSLSDLVPGCR